MPHLPRLLARTWESCNHYAIHIDAKVAKSDVAALRQGIMRDNAEYANNVHFMPQELITYRGVSMLLNTINGMELLLERGAKWDFFINLSGSDYPLVSVATQRKLLASASPHHNYISLAPVEKWSSNTKFRFSGLHVDEALDFRSPTAATSATKVLQLDTKNPVAQKPSFVYTNAEAWMINSRAFCEFVTRSAPARKLLLTFAYSVESSEHYFSTLAYNSRFNSSLVPSALRHVIWEFGERVADQHPFYVDEKGKDGNFVFGKVAAGSPHFYIRKFKHPDSPLMDLIDSRVDDPEHLKVAENHFRWVVSRAASKSLGASSVFH